MSQPTPFKIEIAQSTVNKIMERVRAFEWPEAPEGGGWAYGSELATMKDIVEYWLHGYDWFREQEILNRLPHFKARVRDLINYAKGKIRILIAPVIDPGSNDTDADLDGLIE